MMTNHNIAERMLMPSAAKTVRNYIVCYSTPLVAEDISSGISEWDPKAMVQVCGNPGELAEMLERTPSVHAVIAAEPSAELSRSGLLRMLGEKGGHLIWLATRGDIEVAGAHPSVVALDVPFTTETLHVALNSLRKP
ncbi:MAG: hypothetical protein HLUCCA24_00410 [Rhodobacteraceae bacterium HLUCCA24]|nr:MAG: hypothetical protein HLUCCA24_00410 [Rhodobacteraceae bacterium HLUCCA24]